MSFQYSNRPDFRQCARKASRHCQLCESVHPAVSEPLRTLRETNAIARRGLKLRTYRLPDSVVAKTVLR
jgi:hypothetical protein